MTQTEQYRTQICQWLLADESRLQALEICEKLFAQLGIKDWCIAAGFVRDMVWDKLHQLPNSALNDIDVIYYCQQDISPERDRWLEQALAQLLNQELAQELVQSPSNTLTKTLLRESTCNLPFSVKNQARMHIRNGDAPYASCTDAMSYWPELQTGVGVKLELACSLDDCQQTQAHVSIIHAFDLARLFDFSITHNPKRKRELFTQRVNTKGWLERYSKLAIST
ncbi:nucleotidyltransferase family protein [Shewanella sp. WXL01]|uniref:nucleotidyltransferase family protein n=1 Tax=Shewanella sp. WXL01 TaxID=2709721 RepID=UPI0014384458|nr:nucleotidyltransferase family protein [Shewanella sp. WXL01]NKF51672.1 nucleotidyltransferase family protein [Shewanella sp. WXL01]